MKPSSLGQRYAFVVAAVIFAALLFTAGLRSSTGVLMVPWQDSFGWTRDSISLAAAIGIFLYGLAGPFAAAVMQSFGIRRTLLAAVALMTLATALTLLVREPWQLILTWGVLSGLGSGCVGMVLAATIVNRWFVKRRGLVTGLLAASTATGTLIFLPALAALTEWGGWRPVVITLTGLLALLLPAIWFLLPERPSAVGAQPFGADPQAAAAPEPPRANPFKTAIGVLFEASKSLNFWLLFGTFFFCGFTTNGLVGTHMISLCVDNGLAITAAAGLLAMMGVFDLVGTTASGWLTDRYDPRILLFFYYVLRGISLIYLPYSDFSLFSLSIFAAFYGMDWLATVPPTIRLANQAFGEAKAPIVFGWVFAGHQFGAASAAYLGGALRTSQGSYLEAFVIAGATAVLAGFAALLIGRVGRGPQAVPA
jgi:MFS family permease